ncbi:MAG TPA: sulfur transferase domain-containing protein [Gemmatimonadales bacterium]|nr:sulfur transferase domain-containing protein [Gemmatimonadales bacterium]
MSTPYQALSRVVNACQALPNVVTGGQPDAAQLAAFKEAGGQVVLDIRDPREPRPLNEAETAQRLGLEYVVVPVSPETQTDATLERIREVLRTAGDRNVFFHCASANRVGATLIPYLIIDQGMDREDAINEAVRVGLRNQQLLEWALDYVDRHERTRGD